MRKRTHLGKKLLLWLTVCCLFLTAACPAALAEGHEKHWAAESIQYLMEKGIIKGDTDGAVAPDRNITRAELAALVNRAFSFAGAGRDNFPDVTEQKWYFEDLAIAKEMGYLIGGRNGNVSPERDVTRAETAVILFRVLGLEAGGTESAFRDRDSFPSWSVDAIDALSGEELLSGYPDGTFRAQAGITRAEVFTILAKILQAGFLPDEEPDGEEGSPPVLPAKRGTIDTRETAGGARFFVYLPKGIVLDRQTAPIILVYGDENYTAASAYTTAVKSGLAQIAAEEQACIAFVNSKGEDYGEADVDVYEEIVRKNTYYMERPDDTWKNGKTEGGQYQGYLFRIYVAAEGRGADFVSRYLVDDSLNAPAGGGIHSIPASYMLFNVNEKPDTTKADAGTKEFGYPAVIVNGRSFGSRDTVAQAYKDLNPSHPEYVAEYTSEITDGFDPALIAQGYAERAGRMARYQHSYRGDNAESNIVLMELPDYSGLEQKTAGKVLADGTKVEYLEFIPKSAGAGNAEPGSVPLVMIFHGGGEKAQYFSMVSGWPELGAREGFMTVAVDQHVAYSAAQIDELREKLLKQYPFLDESRVYATGFSMGSVKTWSLGLECPESFAAIAPMDALGGTDPEQVPSVIMPTLYLAGEEDYLPAFPSQLTDPAADNTKLEAVFEMNLVSGGYAYDGSKGRIGTTDIYWGTDFERTVTADAAHSGSVITLNYANDYTVLASVSGLSHVMSSDNISVVWEFLKQFRRDPEDHSIQVFSEGTVDTRYTADGDEFFVYVPKGIELDRWTAPILLVYGDEKYTAASAYETAVSSGLADLAAQEHICPAFVNSRGDSYGPGDVDVYKEIVKKDQFYMERPGATWKDGKTADGQYAGYLFRINVIGESRGADFISEYLVDDSLSATAPMHSIPASYLLFHASQAPDTTGTKASSVFGYPAYLFDGAADVVSAYESLNQDPGRHVVSEASSVDGFGSGLIEKAYGALTGSTARYQLSYADSVQNSNIALMDTPDESGAVRSEKSYSYADGRTVNYLQYIPSAPAASPGGYPIVFCFHGAGEKAEYFSMLSGWAGLGAQEGFVTVVVDQHIAFNAEETHELVQYVLETEGDTKDIVDKSRVYATGFSMGSFKTWGLGLNYPETFAAIAPMDLGMTERVPETAPSVKLPALYLAGQQDTLPCFPSQGGVNQNIFKTLFAMNGLGEFTYNAAFNTPELSWQQNGGTHGWGMEFTDTVTLEAEHGTLAKSRINVHTLEDEDGNVYTAFADVSDLSHTLFGDNIPVVWEFLKSFRRDPVTKEISGSFDISALGA